MKKTIFLFNIILCLFSMQSFAKTYEFEGYNWQEKRTINKLSTEDEKEQAIILKDKRAIEYVYNSEGRPEIYKLIHKIIKVNSDDAIQYYNKVYISMSEVINIVDLKVRVITKDGKTTELNKENIKEVDNLENAGAYKIFAIEGAEKYCEIEYFYIIHTYPSYYGKEIFQSGFITRNIDFELISPINLTFSTKSYNGLAEITRADTTGQKKQIINLSVKEIPALNKEDFSTYNANKMRINYKLAANGTRKIFKWSDQAEETYKNVYYWKKPKEIKSVDKFLKSIGVNNAKTEEAKVILIENYLKNNFVIDENSDKDGFFVETILQKKIASKFGMLRLFAAIFTKLDIKHQLVLTSDRNEEKFDPKFEYFGYLDNFLIYLENLNKYIAPYEYEYRYPFVPHYWTNNYGLFIKPVVIDNYTSAVDNMKFIPATEFDQSQHNHTIKLNFKPEFDGVIMDYTTSMSGHTAVSIQPYLNRIKEDKLIEFAESMIKSSAEDGKVSHIEVLNYDMNGTEPLKPLMIKGILESDAVLEKAGNKHLLKVGELIGRQSELYQNSKRQQDAENPHNHSYIREITINIPDGYKITNLNDLKLNVTYDEKGTKTMGFESEYILEGNVLKIIIHEYYKNIVYPLAIFEDFRKVINAAADFNKITLIVEKK